jgi:hypothetical protein
MLVRATDFAAAVSDTCGQRPWPVAAIAARSRKRKKRARQEWQHGSMAAWHGMAWNEPEMRRC